MQLLLASTSHYVGIVLDIIVSLTLLIYALIGFHKGFFKSLIALFSTAVVLIIAIYFANHFAKLLNSIYDFTSLIAKKLAPSIEKLGSVYSMAFPSGMSGSEFYSNYIDTSSTNAVLKKFFKFALKGYSAEDINGLKVSEVLAGSIASIIMTVVAGILLFIIIKVILSLLSRFFDNITRTHVLGGLNKLVGLVFGAVQGLTIIAVFVFITICVSFVPALNKKIYPLVQNDTKVVKVIYNTADKLVEDYFIKKDVVSKWVNNLWDNRDLDKVTNDEEPSTEIEATVLDVEKFNNSEGKYSASFELEITNEDKYFKLNTFISDKTNANITLTLTFEGEHDISTKLFKSSDLNNEFTRDATSTNTIVVYNNISYEDLLISLKTDATLNITLNISIE